MYSSAWQADVCRVLLFKISMICVFNLNWCGSLKWLWSLFMQLISCVSFPTIYTYIHTYIHMSYRTKKFEQVNWPVKKRKETSPYHGDTYFKTAAFCNLQDGWWCILI